jgi:hypothetical protein
MNNLIVGSKVRMNLNIILSKTNGVIPKWYTDKIFTVAKITGELDFNGFRIIEVVEPIPDSNFDDSRISSIYLDLDIKCNRKAKLEKINEN